MTHLEQGKKIVSTRYLKDKDLEENKINSVVYKENTSNDQKRVAKENSIMININGETYNSMAQASRLTGLSGSTINKYVKQLKSSKRQELTAEIRISKTFTFKKI